MLCGRVHREARVAVQSSNADENFDQNRLSFSSHLVTLMILPPPTHLVKSSLERIKKAMINQGVWTIRTFLSCSPWKRTAHLFKSGNESFVTLRLPRRFTSTCNHWLWQINGKSYYQKIFHKIWSYFETCFSICPQVCQSNSPQTHTSVVKKSSWKGLWVFFRRQKVHKHHYFIIILTPALLTTA